MNSQKKVVCLTVHERECLVVEINVERVPPGDEKIAAGKVVGSGYGQGGSSPQCHRKI